MENEDRSNSQGNDEVNSREILDSFKRRQEMQAYAICQGVTARSNVNHNHSIKSHRQNATHMSYQFHPVSDNRCREAQNCLPKRNEIEKSTRTWQMSKICILFANLL